MQIKFLNMSAHILGFRSVFWLLGVLVAGLIVTGMLVDFPEQEVSEFPSPPSALESDVHSYRSILSETVLMEIESTETFEVENTVQPRWMSYQSEAVVVEKKEAEDPPPTKMVGNQKKVPVTTESVKVNTVVSVNTIAKPMVVSQSVRKDSPAIDAAQAVRAQVSEHLTASSVQKSVDKSISSHRHSIAKTSFNSPQSITTDGLNMYVADTNNHKIRIIEIATGRVSTLAGSGVKGDSDGVGKSASFNYPRGVVVDDSHLYVTDTGNHVIRKINLVSGQVITLAGSGEVGRADKIGAEASFNSPRGIAIRGKELFVADYYNRSIRKVDIETGRVTNALHEQNWWRWSSSEDELLPYFPGSIAIDDDTLYVADYDNHTIRKIQISSGKMDILAGSGRPGSLAGIGEAASFHYPCEIAIIGDALYVADSGSHAIRKIEMTSGKVAQLTGLGANGMGEDVTFNTPFGITPYGNKLFIADQGDHNIYQIDLTNRMVDTMAGSGQAGSIDSEASKSKSQE